MTSLKFRLLPSLPLLTLLNVRCWLCLSVALTLGIAPEALAATIRVPQDAPDVQTALDRARSGDVVVLGPGRYSGRFHVPTGVALRSQGDDRIGERGLLRAEATVLDGGEQATETPGVVLAPGAILDGFTVTRMGRYDAKRWQRHYDTQGEELGDDEGAAGSAGVAPAVEARGDDSQVRHNIVHHNGSVGIAVGEGAQNVRVEHNFSFRNMGGGIGIASGGVAWVRHNVCFQNLRAGIGCRAANPWIELNTCYDNVRAGIGCREGAAPIIRNNRCYQNRRAGIGIRMPKTSPHVTFNHCYENHMAGIGNRDGASPTIARNQCYRNKLAGIGCDNSQPTLIGNVCRENRAAGIGMRGADALLVDNRCIQNQLVAVGITQGSKATLIRNHLERADGGMPPLVAIKDGSTATLHDNHLLGGGVATILVQGAAEITNNRLSGKGGKQGSAVWVWKDASVTITANEITNSRHAINASQAKEVVAIGNTMRQSLSADAREAPALIVLDRPAAASIINNDLHTGAAEAVQVKGDVRGNSVQTLGNRIHDPKSRTEPTTEKLEGKTDNVQESATGS